MFRRSIFLLPFVLLACSSSDSDVVADAAEDADYGDGPITTRPDDGVDTAIEETGTDGAADTSIGDGSDGASESATDAATDAAADGASDVASDTATPASPSDARIHEVYVDRNFEGDTHEFVEISAPAGVAIDTLHVRGISPAGLVIFDLALAGAGVKMPASGFWVVGGSLASTDKSYSIGGTEKWGLTNDSGALQLTRVDGETTELLDVVAWATAPMAPSSEPKAVVEGTPAVLPPSGSTGKTFGRKSVPGDTNANGADFCVMAATPKAANGPCL